MCGFTAKRTVQLAQKNFKLSFAAVPLHLSKQRGDIAGVSAEDFSQYLVMGPVFHSNEPVMYRGAIAPPS